MVVRDLSFLGSFAHVITQWLWKHTTDYKQTIFECIFKWGSQTPHLQKQYIEQR